MDIWKFYDITHRQHVVCNPMSLEKLDRLIRLFRLLPGARVVEIAMGKGEFIIRLAESYGVSGIGVDISPFCVAAAERKLSERITDARIVFEEMDGAEFTPDVPESCDLVACIGADWIYGGYKPMLEALLDMVAPSGWIVVGQPYWRRKPPEEYLGAINAKAETFDTHAGNVATAEELGLQLVYTLHSSTDDWDEYEGLQWHAADIFARTHADDADVAEVMRRVAEAKAAYVNWGRDTLGWAIYAFRKP
jgi:SAM-dependent methyltransferase